MSPKRRVAEHKIISFKSWRRGASNIPIRTAGRLARYATAKPAPPARRIRPVSNMWPTAIRTVGIAPPASCSRRMTADHAVMRQTASAIAPYRTICRVAAGRRKFCGTRRASRRHLFRRRKLSPQASGVKRHRNEGLPRTANAPQPCCLTARATPVSLFPFPREGNGAHPISGLPEIGHVSNAQVG
jgi:hypothetical protein